MYYVTGRYKIFGEGLQLYGDIMYSHTKQDNALAGAPFAVAGTVAETDPGTVSLRRMLRPSVRLAPSDNAVSPPATGTGQPQIFLRQRLSIATSSELMVTSTSRITASSAALAMTRASFTRACKYPRIDSGDAQFTPLFAEIVAGNFNPYIGQNAPAIRRRWHLYDGSYYWSWRSNRVHPGLRQRGRMRSARPISATRSSRSAIISMTSRSTCTCSRICGMGVSIWPLVTNIVTSPNIRSLIPCRRPAISSASTRRLISKFQQESRLVLYRTEFPDHYVDDEHSGRQSLELALAWRYEKFNG